MDFYDIQKKYKKEQNKKHLKKLTNKIRKISGAYLLANFLLAIFILGGFSLKERIQNGFNASINGFDIGFFIMIAFTGIISFIYFTEHKRLAKREKATQQRQEHSADNLFKETNAAILFFPLVLPPLVFAILLAGESFFKFISIYLSLQTSYAVSALLFLRHAKKKKWFEPRYFFYGGMVFGVISGILQFIIAAILFKILPDTAHDGIKTIAVWNLITGWYFGAFFMLVFWSFVVNRNLKPKIISCILFLIFAVGPVWAAFYH